MLHLLPTLGCLRSTEWLAADMIVQLGQPHLSLADIPHIISILSEAGPIEQSCRLLAIQWSADSPAWGVGATLFVPCNHANQTWLEARVLDPFQALNHKDFP